MSRLQELAPLRCTLVFYEGRMSVVGTRDMLAVLGPQACLAREIYQGPRGVAARHDRGNPRIHGVAREDPGEITIVVDRGTESALPVQDRFHTET